MESKKSFIFKLEIAGGLAAFAVFADLGWARHLEPFYTYSYIFAWLPFLWVLDRVLLLRGGAGYFSRPKSLAALAALSTTFWLLFEAFNFRLHNWFYSGLPASRALRWSGYALSFATVMPGIMMLSDLLETYLPDGRAELKPAPLISTHWATFIGIQMLLLPLLWPAIFFPLVWGSLFFLLDPWVAGCGGHSLLADWKERRWRSTVALMAAGLFCGLFWEACNFKSGGKWRYALPYWGFGKIFEMPVLGFIGFLPFALEVHAFYEAAKCCWGPRTRPVRSLFIVGMAAFWIIAFYGIDRWSVVQ